MCHTTIQRTITNILHIEHIPYSRIYIHLLIHPFHHRKIRHIIRRGLYPVQISTTIGSSRRLIGRSYTSIFIRKIQCSSHFAQTVSKISILLRCPHKCWRRIFRLISIIIRELITCLYKPPQHPPPGSSSSAYPSVFHPSF